MSPWDASVSAWIGGGVVGAVLAKKHRIAGFALGAILVGAVTDKLIERYHPRYTGHARYPAHTGYDFDAFRARYPQMAHRASWGS
jgi:hypothetical protein